MARRPKKEGWENVRPPYRCVIRGVPRTMFYRSHLAAALNREHGTIRAMVRSGVLSHPRAQNGRGWYLYTKEQIEDLRQLAREEGVLDPSYRRPFSDRFVKEAHKILNRKP